MRDKLAAGARCLELHLIEEQRHLPSILEPTPRLPFVDLQLTPAQWHSLHSCCTLTTSSTCPMTSPLEVGVYLRAIVLLFAYTQAVYREYTGCQSTAPLCRFGRSTHQRQRAAPAADKIWSDACPRAVRVAALGGPVQTRSATCREKSACKCYRQPCVRAVCALSLRTSVIFFRGSLGLGLSKKGGRGVLPLRCFHHR